MHNFSLADFERDYATWSGRDLGDMQVRARHQTLDGLRPRSSRKGDPQVEVVHGVVTILGDAVRARQVDVARNIRAVAWLRPFGVHRFFDAPGTSEAAVRFTPMQRDTPLALVLAQQLEDWISAHRQQPADSREFGPVEQIAVWEGMPRAAVRYGGERPLDMHFGPPRRPGDPEPRLDHPTASRTVTIIPGMLLRHVAVFIAECRAEAERRGVVIDTDSVWRALGPDPAKAVSDPSTPQGGSEKREAPDPRHRDPAPTRSSRSSRTRERTTHDSQAASFDARAQALSLRVQDGHNATPRRGRDAPLDHGIAGSSS